MFGKLIAFVLGVVTAVIFVVAIDAKTLAAWAESGAVYMGKGARGMGQFLKEGAKRAGEKSGVLIDGAIEGAKEGFKESKGADSKQD